MGKKIQPKNGLKPLKIYKAPRLKKPAGSRLSRKLQCFFAPFAVSLGVSLGRGSPGAAWLASHGAPATRNLQGSRADGGWEYV